MSDSSRPSRGSTGLFDDTCHREGNPAITLHICRCFSSIHQPDVVSIGPMCCYHKFVLASAKKLLLQSCSGCSQFAAVTMWFWPQPTVPQ